MATRPSATSMLAHFHYVGASRIVNGPAAQLVKPSRHRFSFSSAARAYIWIGVNPCLRLALNGPKNVFKVYKMIEHP